MFPFGPKQVPLYTEEEAWRSGGWSLIGVPIIKQILPAQPI